VAERKAFLLRIDPTLLDAVQRWADDDLRSLNGRSSSSHQADLHPARPLAGLHPRRRRAVPGDREGPLLAYRYTAKGNLVAVVSNGTAVLWGSATSARWPASR
jgi:hypothetical protein